MGARNLTFSELSLEDIKQAIYDGAKEGMNEVEPRLAQLEKKFKFMAPSLDRETAADYCNKGVHWIDKQRKENNLPTVDVGHPRILKDDLDHLLSGGSFDSDGNKLPIEKKLD